MMHAVICGRWRRPRCHKKCNVRVVVRINKYVEFTSYPTRAVGGGKLHNDLFQNFVPMDVAAIKRIPLGRFDEDFWAWTGERHGLYSVRSAYRILAAEAQHEEDYSQNRSECSHANNSWIWKELWQIKVPPKVRVFWWRVYNESIPSRANLHRRHIEPLSTCV
jgi:hypothetical protein